MWVRPLAPWLAWHTNLWRDPGSADTLSIESPTLLGNTGFEFATVPVLGAPGSEEILDIVGEYNPLFDLIPGDVDYEVFRFRLVRQGPVVLGTTEHLRAGIARSGPPLHITWFVHDLMNNEVWYGRGPSLPVRYETQSASGAIPVIEINMIPEPARTGVFVAIALFVALRTRWRFRGLRGLAA